MTRIAHAEHGGRSTFPARDAPLFDLYDRPVAATDGAVDPLVGRGLERLGYDARNTLTSDPASHDPDARTRGGPMFDATGPRSPPIVRS